MTKVIDFGLFSFALSSESCLQMEAKCCKQDYGTGRRSETSKMYDGKSEKSNLGTALYIPRLGGLQVLERQFQDRSMLKLSMACNRNVMDQGSGEISPILKCLMRR